MCCRVGAPGRVSQSLVGASLGFFSGRSWGFLYLGFPSVAGEKAPGAIHQEGILEGESAEQHAALHVFSTGQAELDFFTGPADLDRRGYEVTFMLLPVARPDMGLVDDIRHNGCFEGVLSPVGRDLETNPVAGQLLQILDVNGRPPGARIGLGRDIENAPIGQIDGLFPTYDFKMIQSHSGSHHGQLNGVGETQKERAGSGLAVVAIPDHLLLSV